MWPAAAVEGADTLVVTSAVLPARMAVLPAAVPAAQASFNKLSLVGYAREEIIELMSQVLAYSIKQMLDSGQPFDMPGYERLLRELPTLPELADEAAQ